MFQVGDYVMTNPEGLCHIDSVVPVKVSEEKTVDYFVLIPVGQVTSRRYLAMEENPANARLALSRKAAETLVKKSAQIAPITIDNERLREQIYHDMVRSLNPENLIGLIKHIHVHNAERARQGKKHTAMDDRYMKLAEKFLLAELEQVLSRQTTELRKVLFGIE